MKLALAALALAAGLAAGTPAWAVRAAYKLDGGTCDGLPRAPIGMAKGLCAGLVFQTIRRGDGPFMPRTVLALDRTGRDWLVADLGNWVAGQGAVWRLTWRPGSAPITRRLLAGLSMPHTVARGPDGAIYVGEMSRIVRFDPDAPDPAATVTPVVTGLPDNRLHDDRHPLSAFIFTRDGALWVDVGASTDACDGPTARDAQGRCIEIEGPAPRAVVRRYAPVGPGRWDPGYTVMGRGLRNSVALMQTRGGAVLQAENSYDFPDPASPQDEVNLLEPVGGFFGWPYCFDADRTSPAYAGKSPVDCRGPAVRKPLFLLPPHAAPIAMTYGSGPLLPQIDGRLLMTWRGWRPAGARLVSYATDAKGLPRGAPVTLTPGWSKAPGLRPRGAPAGVTVAPDGAVWLCDDKNGAVLRIAPDRP